MRNFLLVVVGVVVVGCATSAPELTDEAANYEATAEISPCPAPVGQWCIETPPPVPVLPLLHSVWAVSASNVFAVGSDGTIWHRNGSAWSVMPSGTTKNLLGVWAANASDVWAVGVAGTILRYNGTAWSTVSGGPTSDIDAVWGSSSTDVWLVGSGLVTHWNGTAFSPKGFSGTFLSVSGTGPADVWATGENTYLRHYAGNWTTVRPDPSVSTMFAVLAVGISDVWVTDFTPGAETMHWNGSKWGPHSTNGAIFNSLTAGASNDIWGVGGTYAGHWDGTAWTSVQPFGIGVQLWSITNTAGHLWVVGDGGLLAHQAL